MTVARPVMPSTRALLLGFIAVCAAVCVFRAAEGIMIPFMVAVFVWYLINAIARLLETRRWGKDRAIPRFWRFFLAVLAVLGLLFTIYEMVHSNLNDVIREAPKFQASLVRIVNQAAGKIHLDHDFTAREIADEVARHADIGAVIRAFAGMLTGIAGKTLVAALFVGFLLYEQRFFARKLKWMLPEAATRARVTHILQRIDMKIQRYIGVKAFVSFLDSFLTFMILSAFSVDFAGFWGVMAFFLHFIPYAGSFVAIAMPVTIALIQFGDITVVLGLLSVLGLSHAFLGHVLDPYLMGNNLNLSPIFIISNLAMWGMIWGVPGMFLAIPILAAVTITLAQFDATRSLAVLISKTGVIDDERKKGR